MKGKKKKGPGRPVQNVHCVAGWWIVGKSQKARAVGAMAYSSREDAEARKNGHPIVTTTGRKTRATVSAIKSGLHRGCYVVVVGSRTPDRDHVEGKGNDY